MDNQLWNVLEFAGTGSWNSITHANAAVVDSGFRNGIRTVKFTTASAHNLTAGSAITLDGTTNYDGTYKTLAGTATTYIYVPSRYVAETLTTGDTFKFTLAPKGAFEFGGFELTLNAASATSENLTIILDAKTGSAFDYQLYSQNMNTLKYLEWDIKDNPKQFAKGDELDFAWANSNSKTYGLKVFWRRR